MSWAILDHENRVVAIQDGGERPENGVRIVDDTCRLGYFYNGWYFEAPRWTSYQFLLRFTPEERSSFRQAAATDEIVADFQMLAMAAQEIVADDPNTVAGMGYLVSVGLITPERRDEVLAISPPP